MSQLKKLFKFEMLGLSKGDHIIFDPPWLRGNNL